MSFRILGALAAETPDGMAVPLGSPKQRAVLAILLLHVGEIVSTDRLIDLLWGDAAPRTAGHSIQIYVSELRRILEPVTGGQSILTRPPGYQLLVPPEEVDARRFERMVADGARALTDGRRTDGVALLQDALRLWRGPALSDFIYEEFAQPYIRRLHDLHLDAIEELATVELRNGRLAATISLAEAAIQEDPLRERSRELLMLALYRSGRHTEALRTYQKLRELLDEELGLDPSPPLQRLQEQIILHEPSLGPPTPEMDAAETQARNPYKGLRPFTEEDSGDFFGRGILVDRLEHALEEGLRLVALVGPSGSGKSSVVAAGLVPRLRDSWDVSVINPDRTGLEELEQLAAEAGAKPRRLVVIDQFEELFATGEEPLQRQFLASLTRAVTSDERSPAAVVTLRADFYDRPLLFPAFARVFLPGVVNILPMSAEELEAAVVRPAERSGIAVEPGLLASLIADTVDQPGALPLLQYALTELFNQRNGRSLTLAQYRQLGGLRGVLTRRAEELFATLDANEQRIAMQVFLRLVRPGRGTADSRRRLQLSELTALDLDAIALSRVLDTYGRHRLLSFDREEGSGAATVEVAHEALLWEWDRLAGWIDRHRTALRRHETFTAAIAEWEESGRNEGYLLTGARLDEFASLGQDAALQLTDREREFIELSQGHRVKEAAGTALQAAAVRRLERRSRNRLVGLIGTIVVLGGGAAWALSTLGQAPATVALLFHQAGGVDLQIEAGFDRAIADFGLLAIERDAPVEDADEALEALSQEQPDMILVFTLATDVDSAAARHPEIKYVGLEQTGQDRHNLKQVGFADEEGAYLAGAVAALNTETGRVGFIGGIDIPTIWRFQAGFEAGARAVDPDIEVLKAYLTEPPNYEGFVEPPLGDAAATTMYADGVDVIFHAAGGSGDGVFEAAAQLFDETGARMWVIGVDTDQYHTVGGPRVANWQRHILTSVLKRIDVPIYDTMQQFAQDKFSPERREYGLASNAIQISYSGGQIDQYRTQIEALRDRIISGEIKVPCLPADRVRQAAELGLSANACAS